MKIIKTESGWIAVSEEESDKSFFEKDGLLNIIAGTPDTLNLKFSPEVAAVLGVWDAEELAEKTWDYESRYNHIPYGSFQIGYIKGFARHAELSAKKKFTEDDLRKAFFFFRYKKFPHGQSGEGDIFKDFIQSLREYEVETFEKTEDTLTILKLK